MAHEVSKNLVCLCCSGHIINELPLKVTHLLFSVNLRLVILAVYWFPPKSTMIQLQFGVTMRAKGRLLLQEDADPAILLSVN